MCSIVYLNSVSDLKEEIEQSNIGGLEQIATITDERINELDMLANRMAYDPRLTPYMISHEYYGSEAISELRKYKANSSIIDEIMIYYHGSGRIFLLMVLTLWLLPLITIIGMKKLFQKQWKPVYL